MPAWSRSGECRRNPGPTRMQHSLCSAMSSYCDIAPGHPLHGPYHDREYGFPQRDEAVLFERLLLEINQAGLSWETILRKRDGFRQAYDGFDVDTVAAYGEKDRARLLADAGIIRNRHEGRCRDPQRAGDPRPARFARRFRCNGWMRMHADGNAATRRRG